MIINAVQATPDGGTIRISAGKVHLPDASGGRPLEAGDYVRMTLTDEGIGIPQKYMSRTFDPFFTTRQQGSGLGLASCFSIIRIHWGAYRIILPTRAGYAVHVLSACLNRNAACRQT